MKILRWLAGLSESPALPRRFTVSASDLYDYLQRPGHASLCVLAINSIPVGKIGGAWPVIEGVWKSTRQPGV